MENAGRFLLGTVATLISCAILWQAQNTMDLTGAHLVNRAIASLHAGGATTVAESLPRR